MKIKMIALAALVTTASFAETESFNMTVSGDVIKDYCTVDVPLTSFDFGTIDVSDTSGYGYAENPSISLGVDAYFSPTTDTMSLTCATGSTVTIHPDITNGQVVTNNTVIGFGLSEQGEANSTDWVSQASPLTISGDGSQKVIDVSMWFASSTGNLNDLEDSISDTVSWVITAN